MMNSGTDYAISVKTLDVITASEEEAWEYLASELDRNPSDFPFWLRATLKGWGLDPGRIKVFMLYSADELIGVVPFECQLIRTYGIPQKVLRFATGYVSYHPELVSKISLRELLEIFFSHVEGWWDRILVENLCRDGPTFSALLEFAEFNNLRFVESPVDVAPYLALEGAWEDLLSGKKKKSRSKIRKRNEALRSSSELKLEWFTEQSQVSRYLDALVEIERNSWKGEAGIAVSAESQEGRYYAELLPCLAEREALRGNVLWYNERPIAYSLCCYWSGWVGHLKTGFDKGFEKISAGALVIDASLQDAFNIGAREFDFLGTSGQLTPDPHKLRWTDRVRCHFNIEIFSGKFLPTFIGFAKAARKSFLDKK